MAMTWLKDWHLPALKDDTAEGELSALEAVFLDREYGDKTLAATVQVLARFAEFTETRVLEVLLGAKKTIPKRILEEVDGTTLWTPNTWLQVSAAPGVGAPELKFVLSISVVRKPHILALTQTLVSSLPEESAILLVAGTHSMVDGKCCWDRAEYSLPDHLEVAKEIKDEVQVLAEHHEVKVEVFDMKLEVPAFLVKIREFTHVVMPSCHTAGAMFEPIADGSSKIASIITGQHLDPPAAAWEALPLPDGIPDESRQLWEYMALMAEADAAIFEDEPEGASG